LRRRSSTKKGEQYREGNLQAKACQIRRLRFAKNQCFLTSKASQGPSGGGNIVAFVDVFRSGKEKKNKNRPQIGESPMGSGRPKGLLIGVQRKLHRGGSGRAPGEKESRRSPWENKKDLFAERYRRGGQECSTKKNWGTVLSVVMLQE